jgi:hypothetical protein
MTTNTPAHSRAQDRDLPSELLALAWPGAAPGPKAWSARGDGRRHCRDGLHAGGPEMSARYLPRAVSSIVPSTDVDGAQRIVDLPCGPAPSSIHLVSSDDSDSWQSIGALAKRVVARIEKPRG